METIIILSYITIIILVILNRIKKEKIQVLTNEIEILKYDISISESNIQDLKHDVSIKKMLIYQLKKEKDLTKFSDEYNLSLESKNKWGNGGKRWLVSHQNY